MIPFAVLRKTSRSGFGDVGEFDLLRFMEKNFAPLDAMMERAEVSELDIYKRTRDVFHYLHLPYDAEPPEFEW